MPYKKIVTLLMISNMLIFSACSGMEHKSDSSDEEQDYLPAINNYPLQEAIRTCMEKSVDTTEQIKALIACDAITELSPAPYDINPSDIRSYNPLTALFLIEQKTLPRLKAFCKKFVEYGAQITQKDIDTYLKADTVPKTRQYLIELQKQQIDPLSSNKQIPVTNLNEYDAKGETQLIKAIRANNKDATISLLAQNAHPNKKNRYGYFPLNHAMQIFINRFDKVGELTLALLAAGAKPILSPVKYSIDARDLGYFSGESYNPLALLRDTEQVTLPLMKKICALYVENKARISVDDIIKFFEKKTYPKQEVFLFG